MFSHKTLKTMRRTGTNCYGNYFWHPCSASLGEGENQDREDLVDKTIVQGSLMCRMKGLDGLYM